MLTVLRMDNTQMVIVIACFYLTAGVNLFLSLRSVVASLVGEYDNVFSSVFAWIHLYLSGFILVKAFQYTYNFVTYVI